MIYGNVFAEGRDSNNALFSVEDTAHRYNPTDTPRLLRETFLAHGIELNTPDVNQGRKIAFELYFDGRELVENGIPKYLLALESPYINTLNGNREYCRKFSKVFTWNSALYNLPNVVKVLFPHKLVFDTFPSFAERDIFSCLISANKAFREVLSSDLYLERLRTIRWYEKYAPDKFELYGMGWSKPTPAFDVLGKAKRALPSLRAKLFGYKPFPGYQGEVRDKRDVLRRSKFSYCYENSRDLPNWITEKIFDSLLSGCVPVYWGANNVQEYIPEDCFVDRRDFKNTASVHDFLLRIPLKDYEDYQSKTIQFLKSSIARKFSTEHFSETIVGQVLQGMGKKY